ncbi:DUF6882 domain-containing protein [uncultured Methanobrevibacter sp.]|uniref:DUF6882 domain-containing protein n=1 Tax=uncultured Methanobrevibacter sp. TaxID=253161 RepID=UPI0026314B4A|nr:DUF6882 domain-containing protein [uncultured Methanobrevibacter sp.]
MKVQEKPVTIEKIDSFKVILSKYGALGLDKQENLSDAIGENIGELDIEKGIITFGDLQFPVQILGFYSQDLDRWSWAWDNEDIFGESLIKASMQIKALGDEFDITEFKSPVIQASYDACHTLSMVATAILNKDAYYAVSEEGIDIFVAIEPDSLEEDNSVQRFRNTFALFHKNYNVHDKIAFESYTKLKGFGFKPHEDFAVAKIGESRIIVGFTERGNVTHIQMLLEDE